MVAMLVRLSKRFRGDARTKDLVVDVDACRPEDGATALHIAARLGATTTIRMLVRELNASATATDHVSLNVLETCVGVDELSMQAQRMPLHEAIRNGQYQALRALIDEAGLEFKTAQVLPSAIACLVLIPV
jgi:ankyrin repeat protein